MYKWSITLAVSVFSFILAIISPQIELKSTLGSGGEPDTTPPIPHQLPSEDILTPDRVTGMSNLNTGHLKLRSALNHGAIQPNAWSERFLHLTIEAPKTVAPQELAGVNLTVLMDVSGSMSAKGKLDYAKYATKWLTKQLNPNDRFSLVTFSDEAHTLIVPQPVSELANLDFIVDSIEEGGGTNLYAGIQKATQAMRLMSRSENMNRVIILSDGKANIGLSDPASLHAAAIDATRQGIAISTIGLGRDFNEQTLLSLSDLGGGSYNYVDKPQQLEDAFHDELNRAKSVAARNIKLDISFEEGVEVLRVLGWSTQQNERLVQLNLGEIYAGQTKQVVLQIRVRSSDLDTQSLATTRLTYDDLILNEPAQSAAIQSITVTNNPQTLSDAINHSLSETSHIALANWYLREVNNAYRTGNRKDQEASHQDGLKRLKRAASSLQSSKLRKHVQRFEEQVREYNDYSAESSEGQHLLKQNDLNTTNILRNR